MCHDKISDKERLDCLNHRSQIYRTLHDSRISREFRFIVLILTFFLVCIGAKLSGRIPNDNFLLLNSILLCTFALVCFLAYKYLKISADANNWCQKEAEIAEDVVLAYITEKENKNLIVLWEKIEKSKTLSEATHPAKNRWKWQLYLVIGGALLSEIIIVFT